MGWPALAARAQQPAGRVYRVGYFAFGSREQQVHLSKAFEEGLRSLGYRVGENVLIEYRFAIGELNGCRRLLQTWSGLVWTSSLPATMRTPLRR
jgi:putative ABC transport system substrate-binding protein